MQELISFITMYAVNNRLLIYENIVTCSRIIKLTFYCLLQYIDQLKFQMSICVHGSQLVSVSGIFINLVKFIQREKTA